MPMNPQSAQELFEEVVELSVEERTRVLQQACGGDKQLMRAVQDLLLAHDAPASLSDQPEGAQSLAATQDSDGSASQASSSPLIGEFRREIQSGAVIAGRYTLQQKIGEGGMGEVWSAKQTEPIKRKVALKLVKPGMDSAAVLSRFEQERQALAMMEHPNIARVLDAGVTASGQSFFVMELVNGLPLTRYCDDAKLNTHERLELFTIICQAVQHAHQKGIVHRDLKPANILVASIDGKPSPKVIDFGVAKATGGKLTDQTLSTAFGAVVGTLEYMSPEQAGFSGSDIDTRADIYSLGVVLYELLTGLRPIDGKRLRKAGLAEMIRLIQEEEPSRPSTRLLTDESLPSIAAVRRIEPKKLTTLLRGELDWVVMKCLEKSRDRRYETANALARDIQRYLADEAVEARPTSTGYRLRKLLQRNQGPAIAVGLLFLSLTVGVMGTAYGMISALRAQALALQKADEADAARAAETQRAESERLAKLEAQEQRTKAEKRLEQIVTTNEIMGNIFVDLDINHVSEDGRSLELVLGERLKTAAAQLKGDAVGDTVVVARLQFVLGRSLMNLGFYPEAIELFKSSYQAYQSSLGISAEETLLSLDALATTYQYNDQINEAIPLFVLSLAESKKALGADHPETLVTMANLGDAYRYAGRSDEAVGILEAALKLCIAKNGPESINTMDTMNQMAVAYLANGQNELALPLFEQTLKLRRGEYGPEHPTTLTSLNNLAAVYMRSGNAVAAEPLFEELLSTRKRVLGPEHPNTLITMNNLGTTYQANGKLENARSMFAEALEIARTHYGDTHSDTLFTLTNFAACYLALEDYETAAQMYQENLNAVRDQAGSDSITFASAAIQLGNTWLQVENFSEAEKMLRDCLTIRQKKQPDTWGTYNAQSMLGEALVGQEKYLEAEPLLLASYLGLKQQEPNTPANAKNRLVESVQRIIQLYEATDNQAELTNWRAEMSKLSK